MKKTVLYLISLVLIITSPCYAVDYIKIIDTTGRDRGVKMTAEGKIETSSSDAIIVSPKTQVHTTVTITNAAANIIAADADGHDIFIQNNDTTGIIYLNLSGVATVSGSMIVLNPGDSISIPNSTNAVSAIGSIASNANVTILLGQ